MGHPTKKRETKQPGPDLGEALTVQRIPEVRQALVDALAAGERVELDLGRVTEVDVTGLQVLCAAHRWAGEHGLQLVLSRASEPLRDAARRGGFARHKGCRGGCLWSEGEG